MGGSGRGVNEHAFRDLKKRTWTVTINIGAVRQVRDKTGINLLEKELTTVLDKLFDDPVLLCDVLFVIAMANAESGDRISDEEFERSLDGEAIQQGTFALLHALRDFTPPHARESVGRFVKLIEKGTAEAYKASEGEMKRALDKIEAGITGPSFLNSLASRASSRGGTRSGNSRSKRTKGAASSGGKQRGSSRSSRT